MVMTHQAYGPLVGVPRLLELLDDFGLKATFFVPGLTADRYPQTVERIVAAGHEVDHHSYSHRRAPPALEPRRLGAVRLPAASADRLQHRVTREGARPLDERAGRDATA